MRIRRRRKYMSSKLVIIVLLLAFGMGIGYAAISTTLTIDGTSDIDSASWDIHFNNVQVTTGSVAATTPAISNNTTVSFSANLANPGDFYEFKVDVVNAGTLDAKLDAITILPVLTQAQSNYFKYTVTYEDEVDININDSLAAGVTETILIRCEYLVNSDTSLYPTDDVSLNFSVSMTYIQGSGNPVGKVGYVVNDSNMYINQALPNGVNVRTTPALAMQDWASLTGVTNDTKPYYIKQIVANNIVLKSYIGFIVTDALATNNPGMTAGTYYLNVPTTSSELNSTYTENANILITAFGPSNCVDNDSNITCTVNGLYGYIQDSGNYRIRDNGNWRCFSRDNTSYGFYTACKNV